MSSKRLTCFVAAGTHAEKYVASLIAVATALRLQRGSVLLLIFRIEPVVQVLEAVRNILLGKGQQETT